jgi:hypothetical protein
VYFALVSASEEPLGSVLPQDKRAVFLVVLLPDAPPTTLRSRVTLILKLNDTNKTYEVGLPLWKDTQYS